VAARAERPLRVYAVVEVGAVALALLVPAVVRLYEPLYATLYAQLAASSGVFVAAKFALALVAMLPPAVLLGGTLPLLATAFVADPAALGAKGNRLYASNTVGAALGVALGALLLPEHVGVRATYGLGIGLALAAAGWAWALDRQPLARREPVEDRHSAPGVLLAVAFASGFGTLALEVLLIHALVQVSSSTVYTYGAVLLVVLLCLAAGAVLVSLSERLLAAKPLLTAALLLEGALLLALPGALVGATDGLAFWLSGRPRNALLLAAAAGGPPLLVGALVLPLSLRLAAGGAVGPRIGGLLAANTLGGVIGSVGASLVLLERAGLWPSFAAVAAVYVAVALWAAPSARWRVGVAVTGLGVAAAVFLTSASPLTLPRVALRGGERLVALAEGAHGVVSVVDRRGELLIKVDNHYSLAGTGNPVTEERAGHLPLLLHPEPKQVLFVGSASGHTAASSVVHPVESIVLVEIVPEVMELAPAHFGPTTRGVHTDPRTRRGVEDGRNHLRAAPEHYDVIVTDLFVPGRPGVGAMYAREHFRAVREHLAPRGVFCQWLPLYQLGRDEFALVAATFLEVFPGATLWRGDFFGTRPRAALVGINGEPPDPVAVGDRLRALGERGVEDRWVTDPRAFWMLYVGPLAGLAPSLGGLAPNTDDWPRFEFLAGRLRMSQRRAFLRHGWLELSGLAASAGRGDDPFRAAPGPGPEAGQAFAQAALLAASGRPELARRVLRQLRRLVPSDLLEPADPTVAEIWP
jgi:spermidine synthase